MDTTPIVKTKFFGTVNCADSELLQFPAGIPGFEQCRRFLLLDLPRSRPLLFLQSLDNADLCFAAMPVQQVSPGYAAQLSSADWALLGLPEGRSGLPGQDFLQLALVSLDGEEMTANLLAPVIIHVEARLGVQAIQWNTDHSPRAPLARVARIA